MQLNPVTCLFKAMIHAWIHYNILSNIIPANGLLNILQIKLMKNNAFKTEPTHIIRLSDERKRLFKWLIYNSMVKHIPSPIKTSNVFWSTPGNETPV